MLARALNIREPDAATLSLKLTDPEVGTNFDASLIQAVGRAVRSSLPRSAPPVPHHASWAVAPSRVPEHATVTDYFAGHGRPRSRLVCHSASSAHVPAHQIADTLLFCLHWLAVYIRSQAHTRTLLRNALPHAIAARILVHQAVRCRATDLILWGQLYSPFQLFVASYARQAEVSTLACESGVFFAPRLAMSADELWLPHPWGVREAVEAGIYRSGRIAIAHSHDYYRPRSASASPAHVGSQIAFYSSGAYIREAYSFDSPDFLTRFRAAETRIWHAMLRYAQAYPNLHFTVKLHPIEKRAEHRQAVERHFAQSLALRNVAISWDADPSRNSYEHYELGLGYLSTTLYERLELGLKSAFLYTGDYPSAPVRSDLRFAMCDESDDDKLLAWLEQRRTMPRDVFCEKIGAPSAWLAGQLMGRAHVPGA